MVCSHNENNNNRIHFVSYYSRIAAIAIQRAVAAHYYGIALAEQKKNNY